MILHILNFLGAELKRLTSPRCPRKRTSSECGICYACQTRWNSISHSNIAQNLTLLVFHRCFSNNYVSYTFVLPLITRCLTSVLIMMLSILWWNNTEYNFCIFMQIVAHWEYAARLIVQREKLLEQLEQVTCASIVNGTFFMISHKRIHFRANSYHSRWSN